MLLILDHNYNVQYVTSLIVLKDMLITEQYTWRQVNCCYRIKVGV